MSKVIFKLKFQSPNFKNTKMNNMYHLLYIGTREGVALNDDMREFEDNHNKSNNDEYMKYIANRPRSHGLFSKENIKVDLKSVAETMKNYNGYVYRGIISLRENEAIEKGFDKKENWEDLIRDKMLHISKQLNIPYNKLEWVGAFHRESGHPHVHLMMWNKEAEVRNIGAIPKKNIESIRKELTKEIFKNEFETVLSLKNIYRDFLTDTTKGINSNDYTMKFLELDEKLKEINTKSDINKYEGQIKVLNKEISESDNLDEINNKKLQINELQNKIDEANKRMSLYEVKDKIKGLKNQKDIIKIEKELKFAKEQSNTEKYEEYIYQSKFWLGIFKLQKDRKIFTNKKDVIKIKCDLIGLLNKKKMLEIKKEFEDKKINIDVVEVESLSKEQLILREQYLKLKIETELVEIDEIDEIDDKIFMLSHKFQENKWKLDKEIEENMGKIENGIEYIDKEYVNELNIDLDNKINDLTNKINELKQKPLNEIDILNNYKFDEVEASNLYELEKELEKVKKEFDINKKEETLKKLKAVSKDEVKNNKISELEDKIKELEMDLNNSSGEDIEYIQNEILQLKNEITNEKESQILKDINFFELELNEIKGEIGFIDEEFNDFILGDKVKGKTLKEIGEMIAELQVPREGRLQYKLMPLEVKAEINKITDRIIKIPQYKKMFEGYMKSVEELTRLYSDKPDDIKEAKENAKNDIYKRIGNNILKAKKEIVVDKKKQDFVVQKLFNNITKLFSINTNRNEKTKLISKENTKAERKKQYQESKAKGLYSEQELE